MLNFYLTQCTDCGNLDTALCSVEGALAKYGQDAWFNLSFMTQKPVPRYQVSRLIYYKQVLERLKWDQNAFCPTPFQKIVSMAQKSAGSITPITKKWSPSIFATTTTTTTL